MAPRRNAKRGIKTKTDAKVPVPFNVSKSLSDSRSLSPDIKAELAVKEEENGEGHWEELPHNLGPIWVAPILRDKKNGVKTEPLESTKQSLDNKDSSPPGSRSKKHPYGLTPGFSPFPDHAAPSAEDCEEVHRLLSKMHGPKERPDIMPAASGTITGCGEVPLILDSILRTLLSANTTAKNSGMMLAGLKEKFGSIENSPDWGAVRLAPIEQVIEAIKRGGMGPKKSRYIKDILDIVYNKNLQEQEFLLKKEFPEESNGVIIERATKIILDQENGFAMDYVKKMDDNDAMDELCTLPGIGVKTAACVLLFHLIRPCFAVDTHVHRISRWLGWVPMATKQENKTFMHLEVRVPDHLKYSLHQQFVAHGRLCFKCKANTNPGTKGWDDAECPIEELLTRTGAGKVVGSRSAKGMKKHGEKVISGRVTKKKAVISAKTKGKRKKITYSEDEEHEDFDQEVILADDDDFEEDMDIEND